MIVAGVAAYSCARFWNEADGSTAPTPGSAESLTAGLTVLGGKFLFVAKGGGSANKTILFQQTKALLTPDTLVPFLVEKILADVDALAPGNHAAKAAFDIAFAGAEAMNVETFAPATTAALTSSAACSGAVDVATAPRPLARPRMCPSASRTASIICR